MATSVAGEAGTGQRITSPWFEGSFVQTQGWGPVPYGFEPAGHGAAHFHAGVDVGLPCGTHIKLPPQIQGARAVWIDNPGGYGTGLMIQLGLPIYAGRAGNIQTFPRVDIWLGHLRQRLVADGEIVAGGKEVAISNNTGSSTGCHLHFEVRPGGGKYGTDIDPTPWILEGGPAGTKGKPSGTTTTDDQNPYPDWDPRHEIWNLEHAVTTGVNAFTNELVGLGQAALGAVVLLGGVIVTVMALRGRNVPQIGEAVVSSVKGARKRQATQTYRRERASQGAVAKDVREQEREAAEAEREQERERVGVRRNTLGSYRAGLISRKVAQQRLGEPVRATGRRPTRVAFGGGFREPGVYRKGRTTVELRRAQISRVRPSHQRQLRERPEPPATGYIQ